MDAPLLNRRLFHFLIVFEGRNIKNAAEEIGISQPALSMSLRQLEHELGAALFDRHARGVLPTEAGEILYRYASSIRQSARLAQEEIVLLGSERLSRLRLGAGVAWTTTLLPDILTDLRSQFKGMAIDVVTGIGDQLASAFLAGEIDVFLAAGSMPSLEAEDIEKMFIANLPMLAVADMANPLAKQKYVTAEDLVRTPWAGFYEDEGFLHLARHYMALRGLPSPEISVRTNSAAALTALVRGSDMVTILISPLAHAACDSGLSELSLAENLWEMPVNIYYRRIAENLRAVQVFRERVSLRIGEAKLQ